MLQEKNQDSLEKWLILGTDQVNYKINVRYFITVEGKEVLKE